MKKVICLTLCWILFGVSSDVWCTWKGMNLNAPPFVSRSRKTQAQSKQPAQAPVSPLSTISEWRAA